MNKGYEIYLRSKDYLMNSQNNWQCQQFFKYYHLAGGESKGRGKFPLCLFVFAFTMGHRETDELRVCVYVSYISRVPRIWKDR